MNTIIYVTSNRERPEFEKKIQEDILSKCGDTPIVSVSQKPINFGKNICVGDVGTSGFNVCRQYQIACENAKTDFVVTAESDCLYPPDYFTFTPLKLDACYRNKNIYVQKYNNDWFRKKNDSLFSQVVGRKHFLNRLNYLLKGMPKWSTEMKDFPKEIGKLLFNSYEYFETKHPCISFKTGQGMRKHSPAGSTPIYELPYWGSVKELRKKYEI